MKKLTDLQLSEISRLLDERYIYLQLRIRRLKFIADKHPDFLLEVNKEMDLINSINEVLWK